MEYNILLIPAINSSNYLSKNLYYIIEIKNIYYIYSIKTRIFSLQKMIFDQINKKIVLHSFSSFDICPAITRFMIFAKVITLSHFEKINAVFVQNEWKFLKIVETSRANFHCEIGIFVDRSRVVSKCHVADEIIYAST